MKYIVCILLLLFISGNLESQEIYTVPAMPNKVFNEYFDYDFNYYDRNRNDLNVSVKFVFPPVEDSAFAFLDVSFGIAYGVVQELYYIGIAGDIALGLDWFALFSDDKDSDKEYTENNSKSKREYTQFGFSFGGRVYNLLILSNFRIMPFFGCDFMLVVFPMAYLGMEIAYKIVGLEYAYYLPIGKNITRHQISIKLHIPKE